MISIEIFVSPVCQRCSHTVQLIRRIVAGLENDAIQWRRIDVVEEIDYAVERGVLATPSVAINGNLVFTSPPSEKALRLAISSIPKGSKC